MFLEVQYFFFSFLIDEQKKLYKFLLFLPSFTFSPIFLRFRLFFYISFGFLCFCSFFCYVFFLFLSYASQVLSKEEKSNRRRELNVFFLRVLLKFLNEFVSVSGVEMLLSRFFVSRILEYNSCNEYFMV